MKCPICHFGRTNPGTASVVLEKGRTTLVFRDVPAEVCENCGEQYVSADTNKKLIDESQKAIARGVDLELVRFAA